jgi:hypothetical protein
MNGHGKSSRCVAIILKIVEEGGEEAGKKASPY